MMKMMQKCSAACAALLLAAASLPLNAFAETAMLRGDADLDGAVGVSDIVLLQRWLLAVPAEGDYRLENCELDGNGVLDVFDLGLLKRLALAPPEEPQDPDPVDSPLIAPTVAQFPSACSSLGDREMLTVFVDFADRKYSSSALSTDVLREELYGNGTGLSNPWYDSVTNWYDRASFGNIHIDGDVCYYTAQGTMQDYMDAEDRDFEKLTKEVLRALDDQYDFSNYDLDLDGHIDCLALGINLDNASDAEKEYWYGCTATWWADPYFSVDGKTVGKYIILDVQPYADTIDYAKSVLTHELGHTFGLPDYYLYNDNYVNMDGIAGHERMEDSIGDFSSFSKLMLGWLREDQVQWYDGTGTQTFTLHDTSQQGSCLILPITGEVGNITSEYFVVEYQTNGGLDSEMSLYEWELDSGVRILHIQADLFTDQWGSTNFRYEGFGENYQGDDFQRVVRLVNNGNGFYHPGDTCTFGATNFAAYDASGYQTIDTGYTVTVDAIGDGTATVTVTK